MVQNKIYTVEERNGIPPPDNREVLERNEEGKATLIKCYFVKLRKKDKKYVYYGYKKKLYPATEHSKKLNNAYKKKCYYRKKHKAIYIRVLLELVNKCLVK